MNLSFSAYKMGRVVILRQQWAGSIMSKIRKVLLLWGFIPAETVWENVFTAAFPASTTAKHTALQLLCLPIAMTKLP